MPNSYSGLGNILENFVLPMVRKGNLTKDELSRLNDSAIQVRHRPVFFTWRVVADTCCRIQKSA